MQRQSSRFSVLLLVQPVDTLRPHHDKGLDAKSHPGGSFPQVQMAVRGTKHMAGRVDKQPPNHLQGVMPMWTPKSRVVLLVVLTLLSATALHAQFADQPTTKPTPSSGTPSNGLQPDKGEAGDSPAAIRKQAEDGDAGAQSKLGKMYITGDGVPKDAQQAVVWCRKAAEQGNAFAQNNLGVMYDKGEGVSKNAQQAVVWFRKAAEQENAGAQNNLGVMYDNGEGVPKDSQQAVVWFRKAAEQGDAGGQLNLGRMYQKGEGVPKDAQQAVAWYRKAAEQGLANAQFNLGLMDAKGEGIPKDAQQAVVWFRKAAEQGDAGGQLNLGRMYQKGEGVPKDAEQAVVWYRKAAEQGLAEAQSNLGYMYVMGEGVTKDPQQATAWYRKAAEQGNASAQLNLGVMCAKGEGVPNDAQMAVFWYRKAAEQGDAAAQFNLGNAYDNGDGVPKDAQQAADWYRKAAEQGNASAQCNLGNMYVSGEGVPKNLVLAYKWWSLSAACGDETARSNRDIAERQMTREQVAEAQRLATAFKPRKETGTAVSDDPGPSSGPSASADAPKSSGTGFFVSANGYLLTAAHVVEGASKISVRTGQGPMSAKVIRTDEANDVALLKIEGTTKPLPLTSSRDAKLGDTVFTVGFPNIGMQGVSPKLTKGEISALAGIQDDPRSFQVSVPVQPGNSGGPLVDASGNVVGLVRARLDDRAAFAATGSLPQTVNYAIKGSYLMPMLESPPELQKALPPAHGPEKREFSEVVREAEEAVCLILVW